MTEEREAIREFNEKIQQGISDLLDTLEDELMDILGHTRQQHDVWKRKAEALERAIKNKCDCCKHKKKFCGATCKDYESDCEEWEFDFYRFAKGGD